MLTICDKCDEVFGSVLRGLWNSFHISCCVLFHEEVRVLYKMSKEFHGILSRQKENCTKCEKCVEVISYRFCICVIFRESPRNVCKMQNEISV